MKDVVARLEAWLRKNHPEALAGLAPGVSEAEIAKVEARLDVRLPEGMRALYLWHDGNSTGSFAAIQNNRHLMPLEQVAATREMMAGFVDDGTFEDPDWWHKAWVPFLDNGAGSHLCWDPAGSFGGKPGQVIEFWNRDRDRDIVAPSFDAWLTTFVESLEAGHWTYDEESGNVDDAEELEDFLAARLPGYPVSPIEMDDEEDDDEDEEDEEEDEEEEDDD
jgi:cell wall assembly regulator SMI1